MDCTVGRIAQIMNEIAPESQAEAWDNVGLMLGRRDAKVRRLMTSVDITPYVVEEAIENQVDMIIAHHPLIFKPINRLEADSMTGRLIYPLLEHGIAVYCSHTNLDKAAGGTDDSLADVLGLKEVNSLDDSLLGPGFGRIGKLEKPMDLMLYAEKVRKHLNAQRIDIIGNKEKQVQKVAVCGGAGASLMKEALKAGADVLVTGEIKYHDAIEADIIGITILTAGHFYTELPVMMKLIDRLQMILDSLQYNIDVIPSNLQKCPYSSL